MNSSLLTVEEVDGLPVGMICVVCAVPDHWEWTQAGDLVEVLTPATNTLLNEGVNAGQIARHQSIENLTRGTDPGCSGHWVYPNMLRPATPEEIAAL